MTGELIYFPAEDSQRKSYIQRIVKIFSSHLEKNKLRLTNPRRKILDYLLYAEKHLTQDEIYTALQKHGVGKATVFRTLKMLEESHLLSRVTGTDGPPRFEIHFERPHHDHLVCISCGRIQEIQWPVLEKIQEGACKKIGFQIKWHRHEIFGLCKTCAPR